MRLFYPDKFSSDYQKNDVQARSNHQRTKTTHRDERLFTRFLCKRRGRFSSRIASRCFILHCWKPVSFTCIVDRSWLQTASRSMDSPTSSYSTETMWLESEDHFQLDWANSLMSTESKVTSKRWKLKMGIEPDKDQLGKVEQSWLHEARSSVSTIIWSYFVVKRTKQPRKSRIRLILWRLCLKRSIESWDDWTEAGWSQDDLD